MSKVDLGRSLLFAGVALLWTAPAAWAYGTTTLEDGATLERPGEPVASAGSD